MRTKIRREVAYGVSIVQLLDQSNIIVYVGTGEKENLYLPKNKLVLWDEDMASVAAELVLAAPIKDIKLRRDCLVAICELKCYIYTVESLERFAAIDSFDNPLGLCACSTDLSSLTLAMPSHNDGHRPWISVYTYTGRIQVDNIANNPNHNNQNNSNGGGSIDSQAE